MWSALDDTGPLEDLKGINEQAEQVRADTDLAEAKRKLFHRTINYSFRCGY